MGIRLYRLRAIAGYRDRQHGDNDANTGGGEQRRSVTAGKHGRRGSGGVLGDRRGNASENRNTHGAADLTSRRGHSRNQARAVLGSAGGGRDRQARQYESHAQTQQF